MGLGWGLGDDDRHLCRHDEEMELELASALGLEGKDDDHRLNHDEDLEWGSALVLVLA